MSSKKRNSRSTIKKVFSQGEKTFSRNFTLKSLPSPEGNCVVVVPSREYKNFPERNLIKRRFKHALQPLIHSHRRWNLVFVVRRGVLDIPFNDLKKDIVKSLSSLH